MAKTRADLLAMAQRTYVEVDGVRLQSLTELERSSLDSIWGERYSKTKSVDMVMRRELLVVCMVDDAGVRLFADNETALLGGMDSKVIGKLYDAARKLTGMDSDSDEVAKNEKKSDVIAA